MKRLVLLVVTGAVIAGCGGASSAASKPKPVVTVTAPAPVPQISAEGLAASSLELTCQQVRIVVKAVEGGDPASSVTRYLDDAAKGFAGIADPVSQQYAASLRAAESSLPDSQLSAAKGALRVCAASGVKP